MKERGTRPWEAPFHPTLSGKQFADFACHLQHFQDPPHVNSVRLQAHSSTRLWPLFLWDTREREGQAGQPSEVSTAHQQAAIQGLPA